MQSRPRHFWIPLFAALIAFVSGYLFASGGFSFSQGGKPVTQTIPHAEEPVATSAQLAIQAPSPTPAPFHWSQLESTDYATYIANLRAIGCPEQTVRDIIAGDLAGVYAQKRQSLLAAQSQAAPEIQSKALKALDAEQRGVLARLLEPPSASSSSTPNTSGAPSTQAASPTKTAVSISNAMATSTPQIAAGSGDLQAIALQGSAEILSSAAGSGNRVTTSGALTASGASSTSTTSSASGIPSKSTASSASGGSSATATAASGASTSGAAAASTASGAPSETSSAANSSASGQTTEAAESNITAPAEETGASTAGSSGARKWRSPFTPEEEAYRTKYGWRAFDEAQREAVRQENP